MLQICVQNLINVNDLIDDMGYFKYYKHNYVNYYSYYYLNDVNVNDDFDLCFVLFAFFSSVEKHRSALNKYLTIHDNFNYNNPHNQDTNLRYHN